MSQNPPDQPELPKTPDLQPDAVDPIPADPQPSDPDPEPFEPEPAPRDPAAATPGGTPGAPPPPESTGDGGGEGGGGGSSKVPLIVGGIVALLVVGGLALFVMKGDDSRSPEETVRDYFEATQDGDCDELIEMVHEDVWSQSGEIKRDEALEQCKAEVRGQQEVESKLDRTKLVSEKDDKATVEADITIDGDDLSVSIDLVKVDGDWMISNL